MFDQAEVARHCPPRTFQRGAAIAANSKNILTKQCRYGEYETKLTAYVASSNGWQDRYETALILDEDHEIIEDYSCTCPASYKYDGMCKHAVALAITFAQAPHSFDGYRDQRTPETSASIKDFMQRIERNSSTECRGAIRIEPPVCYGFEIWSAHFKIVGPKGSYVMKNIGEFIEHTRAGDHVAYGKKLAFNHSLDAFDDASKKIVQFLEKCIASREQRSELAYYRSSDHYSYPHTAGRADITRIAGRSIHLAEPEAVELLDLIADSTGVVSFEGGDSSVPTRSFMTIEASDPPIALSIVESDKGGYILLRDQDIAFAADGTRMYVIHDGRIFRCTSAFAQSADFLRSVYRSNDERLFVAAEDMPRFCSTMLPELESQMSVIIPESAERFRPVECKLSFYFDRNDQVVELLAKACYGSAEVILSMPPSYVPAPHEGNHPSGLRDERSEERARKLIREFFYPDSTITLGDDEAIARLLFGGLATFQQLGEVLTTPAFDRLIGTAKPRTSIGLSIVGNLINLDISAEDVSMDEIASMLSSYRKRKHFHKLKNGAFLNLEDYDMNQLDQLANDLGLSLKDLSEGHIELPTYRAFYLDQELGDARRDGSFTRYVNMFHTIDNSRFNVPKGLTGTLRPYQEEGFRWLSTLTDMGFGGILADEMGLGKSIQLISLLLSHYERPEEDGFESEMATETEGGNSHESERLPSLIVCPASLVYNWLAEFERFAPSLTVRAIVGAKHERACIRAEENIDVFVTSYDLLRIDAREFEGTQYLFHVLDEAQYIKNHATLTTRAVKRVPSKHRFALTGTPMENRLSELWSIFDFLMPGLFGSYARFRERYELGIVGGNEDAARRLQALAGPFVLRRLKSDALPDLPEKLESAVYVPMTGEQRRLYAAHEQKLRVSLHEQKKISKRYGHITNPDSLNKVEVLAELTKLRQICCDPALLYENYRGPAAKMDAIMELIAEAIESRQKVLVFSQFTSYLERIAEVLDQRELTYHRITGATPKAKRLDLVNAFNSDDVPVFLVSLKAGGTGLNLIGASVVIHADPWWNAAAQNQATDRAHRIGQKRAVTVYRVIAKDSIEERILHLQQAKVELAENVIGGSGGTSLSELTRDDLIDLLSD